MTTHQQASAATRGQVIAAASKVIQTGGATALTLDAVAKSAGISKGGLLHHFPSKQALMAGLLTDLLTGFRTAVQTCWDRDGTAPGRWARAYVHATFDDEPPPLDTISLLAAAIHDYPSLIELVQADSAAWLDRLSSDGLTRTQARVIRMAADSFWSERGITEPLSEAERADLRHHLLGLIDHYTNGAGR